jgi:lysyl endopeptidase
LTTISLAQAQVSFPNGKYQKYINQKSLLEKREQQQKQQQQQQHAFHYNIPPPSSHIINDHNNDFKKEKPYQFAKSIPISISFNSNKNDYIINNSADGDFWRWKIKISSYGAMSLSLIFDQWWIPEHSEVYVYSNEVFFMIIKGLLKITDINITKKKTILGAFKANPSNKKSNQFATTPLKGDSIVLEYFSPAHVVQLPKIRLSRVVYGYKPLPILSSGEEKEEEYQQQQPAVQQIIINNSKLTTTTYERRKRRKRPQSGKCNIDLTCDTAGEDWSKEGRAVAVLLTDENQVYCTGVLLNNAENNGRQLLLTAYHCTASSSSATDIIMFNHEKRSCSGSAISKTSLDTLHGLKWLIGSNESDYALYEIEEPIPKEYNVYLAGWTTIHEPIPPLVGIHHPSGDFKKLSIYNGTLLPTCWSECPIKDHWKVEHWTRGTTEPGSSGSPLFDASHKIVGQLHGGSASCWNKNGYDIYGSFSSSYINGGLNRFLDPNNQLKGDEEISLNGAYLNKI